MRRHCLPPYWRNAVFFDRFGKKVSSALPLTPQQVDVADQNRASARQENSEKIFVPSATHHRAGHGC